MITDTTQTTAFSALINTILVQVSGCPSILAEDSLRRAARQFYIETWAWLQYLPEYEAPADTKTHLITPPAGAAVVGIQHLEADGHLPLFVFAPPRTLMFHAAPREGSRIKPLVALTVNNDADGVPDGHADLWLQTWEHGALWLLRQQRGQPWADPEDAEYQRQQFRSGIVEARARKQAGGVADSLRVQPRRFV